LKLYAGKRGQLHETVTGLFEIQEPVCLHHHSTNDFSKGAV